MKKLITLFIACAIGTPSTTLFAGRITLVSARRKMQKLLKDCGGHQLVDREILNLSHGGTLDMGQFNNLMTSAQNRYIPKQQTTPPVATPVKQNAPAARQPLPCIQKSPTEYQYTVGKTQVTVRVGDITKEKTDAIVNAANAKLQHGGGVAAAISEAAGPELQRHCSKLYYVHPGTVRSTPAFDLTKQGVKHIIHAVGPDCRVPVENKRKEEILASAYVNALKEAERLNCKTIAFPAISTNIFGYSSAAATPVAVKAVLDYVREHNNLFTQVIFVVYDTHNLMIYKQSIDSYAQKPVMDVVVNNEKKPGLWSRLKAVLTSTPAKIIGGAGSIALISWLAYKAYQWYNKKKIE